MPLGFIGLIAGPGFSGSVGSGVDFEPVAVAGADGSDADVSSLDWTASPAVTRGNSLEPSPANVGVAIVLKLSVDLIGLAAESELFVAPVIFSGARDVAALTFCDASSGSGLCDDDWRALDGVDAEADADVGLVGITDPAAADSVIVGFLGASTSPDATELAAWFTLSLTLRARAAPSGPSIGFDAGITAGLTTGLAVGLTVDLTADLTAELAAGLATGFDAVLRADVVVSAAAARACSTRIWTRLLSPRQKTRRIASPTSSIVTMP